MNDLRFFILATSSVLILAILSIFSLVSPWYSITSTFEAYSSETHKMVQTFYLFRGILTQTTSLETGVVNKTTEAWTNSQMLEVKALYQLCGPLMIISCIFVLVSLLIVLSVRAINDVMGHTSSENPLIVSCISKKRRWILFFSTCLATALIFNLISSLIFLMVNRAYKHDIESIYKTNCNAGPCSSFTGHMDHPNISWGANVGWFVSQSAHFPATYTQIFTIFNLLIRAFQSLRCANRCLHLDNPKRVTGLVSVGFALLAAIFGLLWRRAESSDGYKVL